MMSFFALENNHILTVLFFNRSNRKLSRNPSILDCQNFSTKCERKWRVIEIGLLYCFVILSENNIEVSFPIFAADWMKSNFNFVVIGYG